MSLTRRRKITARKHVPHHELSGLPHGVKLLAWARTVRWVGWGFGEALIPVFLLSFSTSFAEAGLFGAVVEIATLLSLPVIGFFANRMSAKVLVLCGLLLYPFVGLSYFLAGATGIALFVVLARVLNGVSWSFDVTGIDTYYRRMTARTHLASSFGYIESFAHLGWIAAALISLALVSIVPVHYLLFAITPFALLAIPFALKAPRDRPVRERAEKLSYHDTLLEFGNWDARMRLLALLVLFMGLVDTLIWLFIPIDAYMEGANLTMVVLLAVVATIPTLSGYAIGRVADKTNKYFLITLALLGTAILLLGLALFPTFAVKLVASFLLGVLMEFFAIAGKYLVTVLGPEETYGSRGSTFESIAALGSIAAPLILGVSLDVLGFATATLSIAGVALVLALSFALMLSKSARSGHGTLFV